MKLLCLFFALCTTVLAQDYIDGQYFIHVDESLVQSASQEEAFVNVLKSFNVDLKKFYHFNPKKVLYVHGDAQAIERVDQLKEVKLVEQNAWAYADQDCSAVSHPGVWGLDRSDQTAALGYTDPTDASAVYMWDANDGNGASAYVFDTGIDITHSSFEGRASFDYTASEIENPGEDNNGHGTHCAGTIASLDYGMAKAATVHAIKILNDGGSGPWSAIIEGMDWLTANTGRGVACGSMSVGGGGQQAAVRVAMENLIASGVPVAVSAGNSNTDACTQTPAYIPNCMTIGATTVTDARASFSNYGDCTDIYAPGEDVLSTQPGEGNAYFSGTSMACPHVAGWTARYLSANPAASPGDVDAALKTSATVGAISGIPSGENLLMFAACN